MLIACSSHSAEPLPPLSVMSALPLFWGEGGAQMVLKGEDQRAPIIRQLAATRTLIPLDRLDASSLARAPLLLLAQPRGLAPDELVALDTWVRAGGRVLVFADPLLAWPSSFAPGDPRRAPPVTLLDPLLAHWGLELASPAGNARKPEQIDLGSTSATGVGVGLWISHGRSCLVREDRRVADCHIGKGRATLTADADLLDLETMPANAPAIDAMILRVVE